MTDKPSFQETFFPANNPVGNRMIFGEDGQNTASDDDTSEDTVNSSQEGGSENSQNQSSGKHKKGARRTKPANVVEKEILQEVNHWKNAALAEGERMRAMAYQNQVLQQELQEKEEARRASEMKAMSEREDYLRLQRKIAVASGDQDFAEDVSTAVTQAMIQKELQNYDRYTKKTQPNYGYSENSSTQQPVMQRQMSPIEAMRQEAYQGFLNRNPWFGKNEKLTNHAQVLMEELTNVLDLDANSNAVYSNEYFRTIESAIKEHHGLGGASESSTSTHYDEPRKSRPSTPFSGVSSGNTMADDYARQYGGQAFTPDEINRTGSGNLQMKVGNKWIGGGAIKAEADKHRKKIVPLANGFQILHQ